MYNVLRFWLDRGVDGFRVDVLWLLIKDANFQDNPPNPNYRSGDAEINRYLNIHNGDQPEVHQVIAEMRSILDQYADRVLIGEIYLPLERLVAYYGNGLETQLPFNFLLINAPWNARTIGCLILDYEKALPPGSWPNWVLGNHDQPRVAARLGDAQARIAAMLLLTLRGTPTMYYGDELGQGKVPIPPNAVQDPWERREPGLGRDSSRTPFQWDSSANAGFTNARPWLPVDANYPHRNVELLKNEPTSILCLYRKLIELRRRHSALTRGTFRLIAIEKEALLYQRIDGDEKLFVALNFGGENYDIELSKNETGRYLLISTHLDRDGQISQLTLRPNEGVVLLAPDK